MGLVELGLDPDCSADVVDLAAVGATLVGWRVGPLEDWHAEPDSRICDSELVRASVATTRLVKEVLSENEQVAGVEVRVVVPDDPPVVTPGAARALLRIVRAAVARTDDHDEAATEAA